MLVCYNTDDKKVLKLWRQKRMLNRHQIGLFIYRYIEYNTLKVKIPYLHITVYILIQPNEWYAELEENLKREKRLLRIKL